MILTKSQKDILETLLRYDMPIYLYYDEVSMDDLMTLSRHKLIDFAQYEHSDDLIEIELKDKIYWPTARSFVEHKLNTQGYVWAVRAMGGSFYIGRKKDLLELLDEKEDFSVYQDHPALISLERNDIDFTMSEPFFELTYYMAT